ncbi:hypothetical protein ES703_21747 [subsurface metagenome]
MNAGIGLGFDINQASVRGVKGNDGVLSPLIAEQDKGTPQTLGLSIIVDIGSEVAALILIKDKLVAAGGVSENKIPEFSEGWVFEYNSLATCAFTLTGDETLHCDC